MVVVTKLLPIRVESHQVGNIVTDTSFQHNTVFVSMPVKEWQKVKKNGTNVQQIYHSV